MKQRLKLVLGLAIVTVTVAAFAYFIARHPQILTQLRHLPPSTALILLALYAVIFISTILLTRGTLRLFDKRMDRKENVLFNAYSSLLNFFGPGQSGPIFRAAYLKKRHALSIKHYLFGTLLYYGLFAVGNALLMFVGSRPWWQTALLVIAVGGVSAVVIQRYARRLGLGKARLHFEAFGLIAAATLLQLAAMVAITGVELARIGAHASLGQILAYTGVANFALFVAITPGAIGFRESFLLASQHLHHLSSTTIVAASVVDRAAYLLFLGVLAVVVVALKAKRKLEVKDELA